MLSCREMKFEVNPSVTLGLILQLLLDRFYIEGTLECICDHIVQRSQD